METVEEIYRMQLIFAKEMPEITKLLKPISEYFKLKLEEEKRSNGHNI